MNFLEYSNMHHCNIIPQEEFEGLVQDVFGIIASNIRKSLGPLGSSATILDGMMTEATKDGYAILGKYRFHNRYKSMIYNLIKAPCTRMNNTVGDGTTTAVVLADMIFNRYKTIQDQLSTMYRLPRQFIQTWDEVVEDIIKRVNEQAVTIDPEDYDTIYNIAYVVSNGNHEISDAIASTYKNYKSPSIKMKDSPTNKSYISPIVGFDFPTNLLSVDYARNQDMSATEKNVHVMIFDHKIETDFLESTIIPINNVMRNQNSKLIVIAPDYDELMCQTVVDQYLRMERRQTGTFNLILTVYKNKDLSHKYHLVDLATVLRGKVITMEMAQQLIPKVVDNVDLTVETIMEQDDDPLYHFIGEAEEVSLSYETGSIFRVKDIEEDTNYQDALLQAKNELELASSQTSYERQSYAEKIFDAKARIAQLEMKNFIYYIGADSELQRSIIRDSVDDVIKCVRSAIRSGIVPGCQIAVMRACAFAQQELTEELNQDRKEGEEVMIKYEDSLRFYLISMIYEAVADVYRCVMHGPNDDGIIKLLPRWEHTTPEGMTDLKKEAEKKEDEIIKLSVQNNCAFDMETLNLNPAIITSTETDTMVLSAASELVKILISGNQCIFLDSEINDTHNDTVEAYV